MTGIFIVGAGECGVRCAFALRELGFAGSVTLIGEESTLPYERPPLSKANGVEVKAIRSLQAYADSGINLLLGSQVDEIDVSHQQVRLKSGTKLGYDKLLLATGAKARKFSSLEGCLLLRTEADARRIMTHFKVGARVGIVGGGFIGLELAATASAAGANVTLIEVADRILGRAVPDVIAAFIHDRHVAEGVHIITGVGVSHTSTSHIYLNDGRELNFDVIIAGVGAVPNVALAEAAGLNVASGVVVDSSFVTSDPHIFAAGDCCNFVWRGQRVRLESWKVAQDHGAHTAAAMLGKKAAYAKVPWFWSDQFDMTLHVAGIFDLTREIHLRERTNNKCIVFQFDQAGRLSAAAGVGRNNASAKDIRIFEKLIEREAVFDIDALSDVLINLKRMLKGG